MSFKKILTIIIISITAFSLNANANTEKECFEKFSRQAFKFNQGLDKVLLKPAANLYNKLPEQIRKGTGNFTSNIGTLLSVPNHILQGQWRPAGEASASFLINSTVGILGFGNPAAKMGLKNQEEDVGQTLGKYGVRAGCYFVMPVFGPTTVRDSIGMVADTFVDPFAHITLREKKLFDTSGTKMDYYVVEGATIVDFRGTNMANFNSLEKNSIDLYAAQKSLFLQDRAKKISNTLSSEDEDWGN
jgi:phospholipid-binding lipoprotein MlaA